MTQLLKQKTKKKEKQWQQIIDAGKEELKKNDNTKKGIIRKTAERLESNGMPLEMICGTISREFHEFASGRYIRDCLADKYKNYLKNRTQSAEVTAANDDKNVLDDNPSQTSWGENLHTSQDHTSSNEGIDSEESTSTQSGTPMSHNDTETTADTDQREEDFQIQIRPEDYTIEDLPKYSSQFNLQLTSQSKYKLKTNVLNQEIAFPCRESLEYISSQINKGKNEFCISIQVNLDTGKIISVKIGRNSERETNSFRNIY